MAIASGIQTDLSTFRLEPGQLLEFEYNGTMRWGIVIAPSWKMNCDCYVFESLDDVPEEVLEWGLVVTLRHALQCRLKWPIQFLKVKNTVGQEVSALKS